MSKLQSSSLLLFFIEVFNNTLLKYAMKINEAIEAPPLLSTMNMACSYLPPCTVQTPGPQGGERMLSRCVWPPPQSWSCRTRSSPVSAIHTGSCPLSSTESCPGTSLEPWFCQSVKTYM